MSSRFLVAVAAAATGAAAISQEMQDILDQHNAYRCMHGVPLMTWDEGIARSAQSWANNGAFKHSTSSQRRINGMQCGENLAWGSPTLAGAQAVTNWYNEIHDTSPYGTADHMQDTTGGPIGHYTQLVWKTSTKLGCGKGRANNGDFIVCQYGPAGNYGGQFKTMVKAPVKSIDACGGGVSVGGGGGASPGGGGGYSPSPSPSSGGSGTSGGLSGGFSLSIPGLDMLPSVSIPGLGSVDLGSTLALSAVAMGAYYLLQKLLAPSPQPQYQQYHP